jgi:putative hydrolase of HD superfamily
MIDVRLDQQMALINELDQLKSVLRRTRVKSAEGRLENSAEHSWHVAMMALLLEEHANQPVDINIVIKMLLLHDIVEIDVGDTFVYDKQAALVQEEKELAAAHRLFAMLPDEQGKQLLELWLTFEQAETAEARFAKALDRIIPLMMNYNNQGQSWLEHGISKQQVIAINQRIQYGSEALWHKAQQIIEHAVEKGWLTP